MVKILLVFFLASCAGITPITGDSTQVESTTFRSQLEEAKALSQANKTEEAIEYLRSISDYNLSQLERGVKYNSIGVYSFNLKEYANAEGEFERALAIADLPDQLSSKILLNLGVTELKLEKKSEAMIHFDRINPELLSETDREKYNTYASELGLKGQDQLLAVKGLIGHLAGKEQISLNPKLSVLRQEFNGLPSSERQLLLSQYQKSGEVEAYLWLEHAEASFREGNFSEVEASLKKLSRDFSYLAPINEFTQSYQRKLQYLKQMNPLKIGVILPLSGDKKHLAQKVMKGIDLALSQEQMPYQLVIRDDQNDSAIGAAHVKELIEKESVGFIIGGMSSQVAQDEYLMAKQYNSVFFSLASIDLAAENKDIFLFELLGSYQAQVQAFLSSPIIIEKGKRVGIFYPETPKGNAILREIWRRQVLGDLKVTAVQSFEMNDKDYQDDVQKFLGISYERERKEELGTWKEINKYSKSGWLERTQVLNPVIDFDWVMIPTTPDKVLEIVPVFHYYEAKRSFFVGGPSWKSRQLQKSYVPNHHMAFVADYEDDQFENFKKAYFAKYSEPGSLLDYLGYEAIYLVNQFGQGISSRLDLMKHLSSTSFLKGFGSEWTRDQNLWLKKMDILSHRGEDIVKL